MVNQYTITVTNNYANNTNYYFFSDLPKVTGTVPQQPYSNVFASAPYTGIGGQASMTIWDNYSATCGTTQGGLADGRQVTVSETQAVTLGQDGNYGTTKTMSVAGGVQPQFVAPDPRATADQNSFEVDTGTDFTVQDANNHGMFIGCSASSGGQPAVTASFEPEPSSIYQIQPNNVFYVAFGGNFSVGTLLDVQQHTAKALQVDFTIQSSPVQVNHNADGTLTFAN